MDIMIHLKQKDSPLDVRQYTGLSLLLADAVEYYQRIGFAKYVGTALNPSMDTFVLVDAVDTGVVTRLISKIELIPEVRTFLGDDGRLGDYIDVRILPLMAGGNHAGGKGKTTVEEACKKLKEAIDSGMLDPGTLNDAKEEFELLNCETVLDPFGGGGGGGPAPGGPGGITPQGGWPSPA